MSAHSSRLTASLAYILAGEDGEEYRYDLQVNEGGRWITLHSKSSGNISAHRSYQFLHRVNAAGPLMYRVMAIEISNGYVSYSNTVSLRGDNRMMVQVFPNPATDEITVRLGRAGNSVNAILYNVNGQTVRQLNTSTSVFVIPIKDLPRGVYMLKITDDTNQWQEKIMKQ